MTFLLTIATSSYRLTQVELVPSIFTVSSHFFIAERKSFFLNRLGAINVYHFLHTLLQYLFHQSISTLRDLREIQFYDLERIENISNASISSSGRLKWILFFSNNYCRKHIAAFWDSSISNVFFNWRTKSRRNEANQKWKKKRKGISRSEWKIRDREGSLLCGNVYFIFLVPC